MIHYLLFDYKAISKYVQMSSLQSTEFEDGVLFCKHLCGELCSGEYFNTYIEYTDNGIIFSGDQSDKRIFCIDLNQCELWAEKNNRHDLLIVIQKTFRTVLKTWDNRPLSISERVSKNKTIVFPFPIPDHRRIVIERQVSNARLEKRGINYPLLAYKYNKDDPSSHDDIVDTSILRKAGEDYVTLIPSISTKLKEIRVYLDESSTSNHALAQCTTKPLLERSDFIYRPYEAQYESLTKPQKYVIDFEPINVPLRVEGAAGTGKTIALLMRAYRLLKKYQNEGKPFKIIFFSHNESTCIRNKEVFKYYPESEVFLDTKSPQSIVFITLLQYCCDITGFSLSELTETDAADAKTYELMMIENVLQTKVVQNTIHTYWKLISRNIQDVFNPAITPVQALCRMLHHEFGIQIKGRTDGSFEQYLQLSSIENVLPELSQRDKELIYKVFSSYQDYLKEIGSYDISDVTIQALSSLNAPRWRRERAENGYDYVFVDEMHLFNFNEQNVFHYIPKSTSDKIPLCFALDYSQSIGDLGDKSKDYIESALAGAKAQHFSTVFRNSPQISEFCKAIAASGTLMFATNFNDPYVQSQSSFTEQEEKKSNCPKLLMCENEDDMLNSLRTVIDKMTKDLQNRNIAIISFDSKYLTQDGIQKIQSVTEKTFITKTAPEKALCDEYYLLSPYDINGLEFNGVIMLGVDEGRVPMSFGTSDLSQHFLLYSSYNLLYLTASRAKYQLVLLGSNVNGVSSCLSYAIQNHFLEEDNECERRK